MAAQTVEIKHVGKEVAIVGGEALYPGETRVIPAYLLELALAAAPDAIQVVKPDGSVLAEGETKGAVSDGNQPANAGEPGAKSGSGKGRSAR